ncbi:DUF3298 domain-containing protein [Metabacillus fastidiosus]|uniref:DUF3298 and DUF4163 domain-containing protein n=1 Tax=Metabacillus fastidiosus TaxID=1458 RepID=UPI003D2BA649
MFSPPIPMYTHHIKTEKVSVFYPSLLIQNKNIQLKINRQIQLTVRKLMEQQGVNNEYLVEMLGYYEQKTNERDIVSLTFNNYTFSGGAHGLTVIKSLTFNVKNGKSYELSDLFKKGSPYVERISNIIRRQIKERDIFLLDPPFKTIKPNQEFYLADKAIVIYFQLYDLTPYVFGFPFFPISLYELEDLIDEKGPLQILIAN